MSSLLTRRYKQARRRLKLAVHDFRTFTSPAVKVVLVALLMLVTVAAVIYALRNDPAKSLPAQPDTQPAALWSVQSAADHSDTLTVGRPTAV
ncbi:hypothetical protein BVC93_20425 [Mycobacterium sp. MS1601]|uniref:hypothetical protein n=1 Tax=Mycobacterium sp. MS1601 TaxID=1936029 RepID=UPI00097979DE|nr:hypothetical protein [Mycobacterium sp. MS1601]AQA04395.1 hypothetical protein BVC93_20425 [Mycobacterium sp. MS1601]